MESSGMNVTANTTLLPETNGSGRAMITKIVTRSKNL